MNFFHKALPSIVKPLQELRVVEGKLAKFEASVEGIPLPNAIWRKDGVDLESNPNFNFERSDNLFICNIVKTDRKDAGLYLLSCTNEAGSVECSARLVVDGKYT